MNSEQIVPTVLEADKPEAYKPNTLARLPLGSWTWEKPDGQKEVSLSPPGRLTTEESEKAMVRGYQLGIAAIQLEIKQYTDWQRDNPAADQTIASRNLNEKTRQLQGMIDGLQNLENARSDTAKASNET